MSSDADKALLAQLKNPFDPKLIKWTTKGGKSPKALAYIDARDVMKRLDDVLGVDKYQTKYVAVDDGFICELSLRLNDGWITRSDGASRTRIEPVKGGISDALKRAANAWGIGRYLYYLNPNKFNADNVSEWPKWALPNNKIENWEDVAEMEADINTGMDEETAVNTLKVSDSIHNAETSEELAGIVAKMNSDELRIFADLLENKSRELLGDSE